jgi:hypothetical protein
MNHPDLWRTWGGQAGRDNLLHNDYFRRNLNVYNESNS